MPNTALNRTTQNLMTNKSGGSVAYGGVVIVDTTTDSSFTTTTTSGLSTSQVGIVLEPNGIANNALGMVAVGGWCPRITLNTASTRGQFIKTHTVAGQGTPHSSPQVEGDFAVALEASTTPACNLFGSPNGPLAGGSGTVTNTGTLTSGKTIIGNGTVDVTVSSLTAQFVGSSSGTAAAASMTTARLLGRTTASSGAVEEITVSTGLSLSAGTLTATGAGSGLVLIETLTASTSSSLATTTGTLSSTYNRYLITFDDLVSSNGTAVNLGVTVSTDNGSTYLAGTNYSYTTITSAADNNGTSSATHSTGAANFPLAQGFSSENFWISGTRKALTGEMQFTNPNSSALAKFFSANMRCRQGTGVLIKCCVDADVDTASVLTNVKFTPSTGTIVSGAIYIYGYAK